MIRVLVVDDHAAFRTALAGLLSLTEDLRVVGVAEDGEQAIALARLEDPDVVLMDVMMPGIDGLSATRTLAAAGGPPVIMMTSLGAREARAEAARAGAHGFLVKGCPPGCIVEMVRAVASGEDRPAV